MQEKWISKRGKNRTVLSFLGLGIAIFLLSGCATQYQVALERAVLMQENRQLEDALFMTHQRLQAAVQSNEQLREMLAEQGVSPRENDEEPTPPSISAPSSNGEVLQPSNRLPGIIGDPRSQMMPKKQMPSKNIANQRRVPSQKVPSQNLNRGNIAARSHDSLFRPVPNRQVGVVPNRQAVPTANRQVGLLAEPSNLVVSEQGTATVVSGEPTQAKVASSQNDEYPDWNPNR